MTESMEKLILVGGSAAGTKITIPKNLDYYEMIVPVEISPFFLTEKSASENIQVIEYTKRTFRTDNNETFKIMALYEMSYNDIVVELIKGYYRGK